MDIKTGIAAVALLLSVIALWCGELHQRRRASDDAQRRAATRASDALGAVFDVLEHADVWRPTREQISGAMLDFERTLKHSKDMLPSGVLHVKVSVREAMANCFGAPATIAVDPRIDDMDMLKFDQYWWDIGYTYVEHVRARFGRWLVDVQRKPLTAIQYFQWRADEKRPLRPLSPAPETTG